MRRFQRSTFIWYIAMKCMDTSCAAVYGAVDEWASQNKLQKSRVQRTALIKKITSSQFYCRSCSILFKRNRSTHPMLNPNADVKMIRLKSMLQFTLIHIGCYMLFDFEEFYSINATFLIFFRLLHKAKRFLTQKNRKRRRIVWGEWNLDQKNKPIFWVCIKRSFLYE